MRRRHPALLMVDSISGLACADYRHDEWGVDVTISGSQKGLMLPPGISFNALSPKAIEASKTAKLPKAFWAWDEMIEMNKTRLLALHAQHQPAVRPGRSLRHAAGAEHGGLPAVFARHQRWGEGVRAAVKAWGLEIQCADPAVYSPVLTGVMMPEGVDADAVRKIIYERFDCSLGTGLGKVKGRMFRIGHLGDCNDLTLMAALAGCEMGLKLAGVKLAGSGVQAAMDYFAKTPAAACRRGRPGQHENCPAAVTGFIHNREVTSMKNLIPQFPAQGFPAAARAGRWPARWRPCPPRRRGSRPSRWRSSCPPAPAARPTRWRAPSRASSSSTS